MQDAPRISNNYFDGLKVSGRHKVVFFIIMIAYFCEQMDNWNFGFIAPALMHNWGLTMKDLGHVTFWYFVAMTCGGLVGGVISDIIGRRKTFLIAITLFSTASIINGLTDSFPVFVASRALTGFGVFCLMVCSQAYIAEMAPAESRGKWQNTVAAVGFCAVPVIGMLCRAIIPLHEEAWRYIFYMGGFGYVALIIAWKYLDESPRWLVARGRVAEAEDVMRDITGQNIDLAAAAAKVPPRKAPLKDVLLSMCSKKYIKRTIVIFLLVVLTNPATFLVTNWTATLLKAHGFSLEDCLMATTLISIGVPVGCFVSGLFSDMGRPQNPHCLHAAVHGGSGAHFRQRVGLLAGGAHWRAAHGGRHGHGLYGVFVYGGVLPHHVAQHGHGLPRRVGPAGRGLQSTLDSCCLRSIQL